MVPAGLRFLVCVCTAQLGDRWGLEGALPGHSPGQTAFLGQPRPAAGSRLGPTTEFQTQLERPEAGFPARSQLSWLRTLGLKVLQLRRCTSRDPTSLIHWVIGGGHLAALDPSGLRAPPGEGPQRGAGGRTGGSWVSKLSLELTCRAGALSSRGQGGAGVQGRWGGRVALLILAVTLKGLSWTISAVCLRLALSPDQATLMLVTPWAPKAWSLALPTSAAKVG